MLLRDLGRTLTHVSEASEEIPHPPGGRKVSGQQLLENNAVDVKDALPGQSSGHPSANRLVNFRLLVLDAVTETSSKELSKVETAIDHHGLTTSSPMHDLNSHQQVEEAVRSRLADAMRSTSQMTALVPRNFCFFHHITPSLPGEAVSRVSRQRLTRYGRG